MATRLVNFFPAMACLLSSPPWVPIYIGVLALICPWFGLFALGAGILLATLAILNGVTTKSLLNGTSSQHVMSHDLANSRVMPQCCIMGRWSARHRDYLTLQAKASDRAGLPATFKVPRLMFQSLILGFGA